MTAYYNESDPYAAQWLRNLIQEGLIARGEVDTRSIVDVRARDLVGFDQCHFFAGLGGWAYALRLAGWPDDQSVWTGSCPCQPFSAAGDQRGFEDPRHLWPDWFRLIRQSCPPIVFGEQVANAAVWFDRVCADMEDEDYAIGAAVLPACSVDAPHKRDRLWFVAYANQFSARQEWEQRGGQQRWPSGHQEVCLVDVGDADAARWNELRNGSLGSRSSGKIETRALSSGTGRGSHWADCQAERGRRTNASIRLLAHGVPNRVGKLRAFGNAIVPQVAAEFIKASITTG